MAGHGKGVDLMPNFTTPTPTMQTKIKRDRYGLNATVTITAPNGLQLITTLAHDI